MYPLPKSLSIPTLDRDKYSEFINWQTCLCKLADQNTFFIEHVESIADHAHEMEEAYEAWLTEMLDDMVVYSNSEVLPLKNGEDMVFQKRMLIMIELFRLKTLLNIDKWMDEHHDMQRNLHKTQSLELQWCIFDTQSTIWAQDDWSDKQLWKKPVSQFDQRDIMVCIQYLCERLLDMPTDLVTIADVKKLMHILMIRNGQLFCSRSNDKVLNMPDMRTHIKDDIYHINRKYAMFCAIYFSQVLQKLRWYDLFYENRMSLDELKLGTDLDTLVERVRQWFRTTVSDALSKDAFDDCYDEVLNISYHVPGDVEWFKYCYPQRSVAIGSILQEYRPGLARYYFSEDRATKSTLWTAAERYRYGFVARAFVFQAIHDYLMNHYNLPWKDYVVIEDGSLVYQTVKLYRENSPFLIQIMSRFWVFDKASRRGNECCVWTSDSIYEAIAVWFHILLTRYNGVCLNVDLSRLICSIFSNTESSIENNRIISEL